MSKNKEKRHEKKKPVFPVNHILITTYFIFTPQRPFLLSIQLSPTGRQKRASSSSLTCHSVSVKAQSQSLCLVLAQ